MAASKKPRGFGKFEDALRAVVSVDKASVDKRAAKQKAKRIKRRKKN